MIPDVVDYQIVISAQREGYAVDVVRAENDGNKGRKFFSFIRKDDLETSVCKPAGPGHLFHRCAIQVCESEGPRVVELDGDAVGCCVFDLEEAENCGLSIFWPFKSIRPVANQHDRGLVEVLRFMGSGWR